MRIGIDIDGVLLDLEGYQLDYFSKYYFEKGINLKDPTCYKTYDIYDVSKEMDNDLWREKVREYNQMPPKVNAVEVVKKLKEEGNEIYLITTRANDESDEYGGKELLEKLTNDWLEINEFKYDKLIFVNGSKLDVCFKNEIDLMIEDNDKNLKEISTKIPCLAYDALYNKECHNKNITRVYSWYHIYNVIKELENNIF